MARHLVYTCDGCGEQHAEAPDHDSPSSGAQLRPLRRVRISIAEDTGPPPKAELDLCDSCAAFARTLINPDSWGIQPSARRVTVSDDRQTGIELQLNRTWPAGQSDSAQRAAAARRAEIDAARRAVDAARRAEVESR